MSSLHTTVVSQIKHSFPSPSFGVGQSAMVSSSSHVRSKQSSKHNFRMPSLQDGILDDMKEELSSAAASEENSSSLLRLSIRENPADYAAVQNINDSHHSQPSHIKHQGAKHIMTRTQVVA